MQCEYGLPADGAGVVFREPAVDAVDVELVGTGQAAQLVALGVLVDADAARAAHLPLQAGLTVGACRQIVDLLFGQAPGVLVVLLVIEQEEVRQPQDGQGAVFYQVVGVPACGPSLRGADYPATQAGLSARILLATRQPDPFVIDRARTNMAARALVCVKTSGRAGIIRTSGIGVASNSLGISFRLH